MRRAIITKIDGKNISAMLLLKEGCSSCTTPCKKQGKAFTVENPGDYPVKVGDTVLLNASKCASAVQGIVSLLFPVLCAIGGYCVAPFFATVFKRKSTEGLAAVFVLAFLVLSSALVLLVTRRYPLPGKPQIVEVNNG